MEGEGAKGSQTPLSSRTPNETAIGKKIRLFMELQKKTALESDRKGSFLRRHRGGMVDTIISLGFMEKG